MTLANYAAANANAPVGIRRGISALAGAKFPELLGPGAPVNPRDIEAKGNALYKSLSRLNELRCDAVVLQLVGDRVAAYNGIIMLMVGPQLVQYVNSAALFTQTEPVGSRLEWTR